MKNLIIDIETYSSEDISKCGVYKYVEANDFEILLFGYSVDFGEVRVVDLAGGEVIPLEIIEAIKKSPNISRKSLAELIGKSEKTVSRIINGSNKIIRVGSKRTGHWEIIDKEKKDE